MASRDLDRGRGPALRCVALSLAMGGLSVGCDRGSTVAPTDGSPVEPVETSPALEPAEASNRSEGEVVDLTLVRPDGSTTELSSMRGKPVLLVVDASWSDDWSEGLEVYPKLLEREDLQVVVVVADDDPAVVDGVEASGLHVAWDPQGAVAAKLSAATFPTLILLGPEGRVLWQAKGLDVTALRKALDDS